MAARSDNRKATPSSAAAPAKSHARGRSQPAIGQQTEMDALRAENERLKKLLVDAMLEISVLKEHPRQDA